MDAGFVYAIRFSTGVVKVGYSKDAGRRIKEHTKQAAPHGVTVTDEWHTYVDEAMNVESQLMILARDLGGVPLEGNREFFSGLDYRAFARELRRHWGDFDAYVRMIERKAEVEDLIRDLDTDAWVRETKRAGRKRVA